MSYYGRPYAGALSNYAAWRLSVRQSHTSILSQEQMLNNIKIGSGSTSQRWLGHHFQHQRVKGQCHKAALLNAVFARQTTAEVGVVTC